MRRQQPVTASLQRWLIRFLILSLLLYLGYEAATYYLVRQQFPVGTTIGRVDVAGLTPDQAAEAVQARYNAPIIVTYGSERVEIPPQDVGFGMNMPAMMAEAQRRHEAMPWWQGFVAHLLDRPVEPVEVALSAFHDPAALRERLETVAGFLDEPAQPPQPVGDALVFQEGQAGRVADVEASLEAVAGALYRPERREAEMVLSAQAAPPINMGMLKQALELLLRDFEGMGSIFVLDLSSGEELSINGDVAMSGLSMVKVAILLETYRALDNAPDIDQTKLISETAVLSGNYSANLLLDIVAGQDNAYLGSDILTESMRRLGLANTFIAVPYEEPPRPGLATYVTPANSRTDINTDPDPAMQTTAEELGSLLAMVYYCAQGGGSLLAAYPDELTPAECQAILDVMKLNVEGNLIRYGVPDGTEVAHKHGWAGGTHGDGGVVYSPGGDYIIVEYLHGPGGWLVADYSFPILRQISRIVYNYFNHENPYTEELRLEEVSASQ